MNSDHQRLPKRARSLELNQGAAVQPDWALFVQACGAERTIPQNPRAGSGVSDYLPRAMEMAPPAEDTRSRAPPKTPACVLVCKKVGVGISLFRLVPPRGTRRR